MSLHPKSAGMIPLTLRRFTLHFPFLAFEAILGRLLRRKGRVILDLGCGPGEPFNVIDLKLEGLESVYTVGADIWSPYLKKSTGHQDLVRCDMRRLPFRPNSGIVLAKDVLEHLTKVEGISFLREIEIIAKGMVIVMVPNGLNDKCELEDRNPWQAHQSYWLPDEFRLMGYKIRGANGLRSLYGERGQFRSASFPWRQISWLLRFASLPLGYFLVASSLHLVCWKAISKEEIPERRQSEQTESTVDSSLLR